MEKEEDVLAAFRLDAPLTDEEVAFFEAFEQIDGDNINHILQENGLAIHTKGEQQWVTLQDTTEPEVVDYFAHVASELKKQSSESPQLLALGASAFTLRLSLAIWGIKNNDTLDYLNSYAFRLKDLGYAMDAEPIYKYSLEQAIETLGEDHHNTLIALDNYAACLYHLTRIQEAKSLYEQALKLRTKTLGKNHLYTLNSLSNYAICLADLGYGKIAEPFFERVWKKRAEILGEKHPDTLYSLNNYAVCLNEGLGDSQKAEPLFKQVWKTRLEVSGEKHPETLTSLQNYASCIADLGHIQEAEQLGKIVWKQRTEILGENHLDTLNSLHNYAYYLNNLGRTLEAEPLYKHVFERYTEILGENHPKTIQSLSNHASSLNELGRYSEAESKYEQAWKLRQKFLGEQHPDTLNSLNNYAVFLYELKRIQESELLLKQVWEQRIGILGKKHPSTLNSLNNYAGCLDSQDHNPEAKLLAKLLYKNAWKQTREVLGDKHPQTLLHLNNYAFCLDSLVQKKAAVKYWLLLAMQLADKPLFTGEWSKRVGTVSYFLNDHTLAGNCPQWQKHFQRLSRTYVEVLDLQPPEQIEAIRKNFITYHVRYIALCIRQHRLDLIPTILPIIQGRKLTALRLDEIEQNPITGDEEAAELKQQFLAIRTELRHLAIGLQANDKLKPLEISQQPVKTQTNVSDRLAEYEQKYDQFRDLRRQLQEKDADFAVAAPMLDITTERLQNGLQIGQAIALLVQKLAEVPPFILLITKEALQLIPLPEDHLKIAYQQTLGYQQTQAVRRGMRRIYDSTEISHDDINNHEQSVTLDDIQKTLTDFWGYCAEALENIQTLHLVTQGNLHILPYDLGCPTHINLYTYPGLLFYYQTRHTLSAASSSENKTLGIKVYDGIDSSRVSPIPLVEAEQALLEQLWIHDTLQTLSDFNQPTQWFALHFACHGIIDKYDPLSAYLFLGESENKQLDARRVLNSSLRPQVVFQSACVVGRVTEDIDGDPLGLVSTFFLRGARYIIAAVQEVDDFYMPLLVCLFYQTWQPDKITPHKALHEAKRRLRTGDWYPDTEALIRKTYQPVLLNYLQHLVVDEEDEDTLRKEVVETWPTCYTLKTPQKDELEKYQAIFDEIEEDLMTDVDNHLIFITSVLNTLCNNKHCLPVTDLCAWVRGFGYI